MARPTKKIIEPIPASFHAVAKALVTPQKSIVLNRLEKSKSYLQSLQEIPNKYQKTYKEIERVQNQIQKDTQILETL